MGGVAADCPSTVRMLARGLRRRCPRCGGGDLFQGYFRMRPDCPRCGHRFEPRAEEGFFLGALTVNLGVTQGAVLISLFVYIIARAGGGADLPVLPVLAGAGVAAAVLPIVFYPFAKTIWAAIDLALRCMDPNRR